jgi:uncharacterized protein (DUF169 family)
MIDFLKSKYGNTCSGIKLNHSELCVNTPKIKMRFCEAVHYSFDVPIMVNKDTISCEGARYSFVLNNKPTQLTHHISSESGMTKEFVKKMIKGIARMNKPIDNFLLGIREELENVIVPDMYVLHMSPKDVMELIKQYAVKLNKIPIVKPYAFLSICANIVGQTYYSDRLCISFGCPESRVYGGITDSHLVVGIPYRDCKMLFN